jgi:hypothetical protein
LKDKFYLIGPTESILTKRGNRFPNIAEYLYSQNKEVVYLTSDFYHAEKRFFKKLEIIEESRLVNYKLIVFKVLGYQSNISVKRILSNLFFSIKIFFFLLLKVKKNDKILIPSRPVELIFFISLLKRFRGCKIILDIQDVWPDALEISNKTKKSLFTFYCNFYLKPSLKHYDSAFYVAPSFENWLNRYANNKVPSFFIPLGWENNRWGDVVRTKSFDEKSIEFVCVAQLQHQINVMPVLEYLAQNNQHRLTIVGEDGTGDRYNEVSNYIKSNKMKNITIIGKVNRLEMVEILKDMDIGVLPMITSSIPNKIFDYIAAEIPIIVLGKNDSANFVEINKIGLSCSFDSEGFKEIINNWNSTQQNEFIAEIHKSKFQYSRNELHKLILKTTTLQ